VPQHAISDAPAGTVVPADFSIEVVGTVSRHFPPRRDVLSAIVAKGMQISLRDTLCSVIPEHPNEPVCRTVLVTSLQIDGVQVERATEGQEVGILTGGPLWVVGSQVLRLARLKTEPGKAPGCAV